eukprot:CAMPEP_0176484982 /NCGR_PEP_ID=MMETSP0200_2-20121128/4799_1 /TAXON_ID=947934 /ORGANISM="Chaetoceros sp., Strain GSL56" /LENGTH=486 /DNA_ID=CAMNT_0017881601 /DNA_START=456 /DNA_END=1918 /DNA_ORIENTATION=+
MTVISTALPCSTLIYNSGVNGMMITFAPKVATLLLALSTLLIADPYVVVTLAKVQKQDNGLPDTSSDTFLHVDITSINDHHKGKLPGNHLRCLKASKKKSSKSNSEKGGSKPPSYEVWASDQSNSVPGQWTPGTKGGFLWIWDSESIMNQLENSKDAIPISCTPSNSQGPCNLLDIFPSNLERCSTNGCTGEVFGDMDGFGRLHGVTKDPFNRYVVANIFAHGYVGVIDTETKEGIGLFRVTATSMLVPRSVHMSFWSADGSAVIIANLNGKMIERIDVKRSQDRKITGLEFNLSAGIYLGKAFTKTEDASFFLGQNAFGKPLIGSITAVINLTPSMVCKESGCDGTQPSGGARMNNVPICPIPSSSNYVYANLAVVIVVKLDTTPMKIIAEYGGAVINGAGCAGVEAKGRVFLDGGVSASPSGSDQSTFTLYSFEEALFSNNIGSPPVQNSPMPIQVFKDPTNTNTIGNVDGTSVSNPSGQLPTI